MNGSQIHPERGFLLFAFVALVSLTMLACGASEADEAGSTPPDVGNQLVGYRASLYLTDFVDGSNHLVVLDLMTGEERVRLPTPSTRATIGSLLCTSADEVWLASNEPGRATGHLVRVRVRD